MITLRPVALAGILLAVQVTSTPETTPSLIVTSPKPDDTLQDTVTLSAEVVPQSAPVRDVTFFVDGQRVCTVTARPFTCKFEAGTSGMPRDVRVVAVLTDGSRLPRALRTSSVLAAEPPVVRAVLVSARVRDRDNRLVGGLKQSDFLVFEDGVAQEVQSFKSETAAAEVILALDASGSMGPALKELRTAAAAFLSALRPTDAVTVATFDTGLSILAPGSATPEARIAALDRIRPGGGTALYDAMIQSADLIKSSSGRRVVVMLTDGEDVDSRASLANARTALQLNDVVLYIIAQGKAAANPKLRAELEQLASETGGGALFARQMSDLRKQFSQIAEEISSQYVLSYSPTRSMAEAGWREITVKIKDEKRRLEVRARSGYFARIGG